MATNLTPDDAVFHLGERQRGLIARHQLLRSHNRTVTDDLLRSGWFDRVARAIYRFRGAAALPEHDAFAAALRARPGATVTGPLALGLLGAPGLTGGSPYVILTAADRSLSNVAFRHHPDPKPARAVTSYGEVRVAGPVDALLESTQFVDEIGERQLRVAWDHLRGKGVVSVARLERSLEEEVALRPEAAQLREILAVGGGTRVESEGERGLAPILGCFEPGFEAQYWITPRRRFDFYSHRCALGIEYSGEVDHAHIAGRIADDERDTELRESGVQIMYVTKHDCHEPRTLMSTIAARLAVRAHDLGVTPPVIVRPLPDL